MAMWHVVIVCGYGCHLTAELQEYLNQVIRFSNGQQPDCIVFSGGYTQCKTAPGLSEAQVMHNYVINTKGLRYIPERIIIDVNAYTTIDNISNASRFNAGKDVDKDTKLTVFCEATRALKINLLVQHFFGRRANIETASWDTMDPTKQILATIHDWCAIKFPPLARYTRNQRIKRAEIS